MNSDKAAAIRDAVNGCPDIVDTEDIREYSSKHTKTRRGVETTYTGPHLSPSNTDFRPAYIEQSGTVSNGDGAERPVFVVVLEALWTNHSEVRSLSPELVYEVAKHDCRIRFYPPDHRLDGDVWIVDHFTEDLSDPNGDRCEECQGTYFKVRNGEPVCVRCGTPLHQEAREVSHVA
jgi:hypothetical protein